MALNQGASLNRLSKYRISPKLNREPDDRIQDLEIVDPLTKQQLVTWCTLFGTFFTLRITIKFPDWTWSQWKLKRKVKYDTFKLHTSVASQSNWTRCNKRRAKGFNKYEYSRRRRGEGGSFKAFWRTFELLRRVILIFSHYSCAVNIIVFVRIIIIFFFFFFFPSCPGVILVCNFAAYIV